MFFRYFRKIKTYKTVKFFHRTFYQKSFDKQSAIFHFIKILRAQRFFFLQAVVLDNNNLAGIRNKSS